jgi:hypothetical protein
MRKRAVLTLALVVAGLVGVAVLAWWPITDLLGRSCGGGVFGTSVARAGDDSYLDVCNGLRDQRRALVQTPAVVGGLVVVAAAAWVTWLVIDDRNRLT